MADSDDELAKRCYRCKELKRIEAFVWSVRDIRKRLGICLSCYRRT